MWNGIGWYGFIGHTTSTTDISLLAGVYPCQNATLLEISCRGSFMFAVNTKPIQRFLHN